MPRLIEYGFAGVLFVSLTGLSGNASALSQQAIVISASSPQCLQYRVVGVCYWLLCTSFGCKVRKSPKVRHHIPDAVVSSYTNTGENPWQDVRPLSPSIPGARSGGSGTNNLSSENNLSKFKNADVIGHPSGPAFSQFASRSGYACQGAGTPFKPYFLSTFDSVAWRSNVPEALFPEALTPGMREIGSRSSQNLWGSIYPRGGFLHQVDDYKAAAVVAQRAGDLVTRRGQIHVYQPLLAKAKDGYWPAGPLVESDASTGTWQELIPTLSQTCATFPHNGSQVQSQRGGYAWALWRPYSCCERRGQTYLGCTDFDGGKP